MSFSIETWKISFQDEDWLVVWSVTLSRWKRIIRRLTTQNLSQWTDQSFVCSPPLLVVRNKMVRLQTLVFGLNFSKTNDHFFPFRFNLWSSSAVKANYGFKNGLRHSRKRIRKRCLANWLPIFWHVSQRCAHSWSGKISKLFTKGMFKKKLNCDLEKIQMSFFFLDMLVCTFAVLWSKLTMNWWHWKSSIDT